LQIYGILSLEKRAAFFVALGFLLVIHLRASHRSGNLLDAVGGTAPGQLVSEVSGLAIGEFHAAGWHIALRNA
jgi:hypothetical protein